LTAPRLEPINIFEQPFKPQNTLFLATLTLGLLDAVTTMTFYLTGRGSELNPVLNYLLKISPFLAIPYLVSLITPVLLFRASPTVQLSIQFSLALNFLLASINNVAILIFRTPMVLHFFRTHNMGWISIEALSFTAGLMMICLLELYTYLIARVPLRKMAAKSTMTVTLYVACYLVINLIPVIWRILL
jgi:hypothetical protein